MSDNATRSIFIAMVFGVVVGGPIIYAFITMQRLNRQQYARKIAKENMENALAVEAEQRRMLARQGTAALVASCGRTNLLPPRAPSLLILAAVLIIVLGLAIGMLLVVLGVHFQG